MRSVLFLFSLIVVIAVLLRGEPAEHPAISDATASVDYTPKAPIAPAAPTGERWVSRASVVVRTAPSLAAPIRAWVGAGEPIEVLEAVDGPGCKPPGWGRTEGRGYVCLANSTRTPEAPVRLPRLVRFVHPDPTEWGQYLRTMTYETSPSDRFDTLVPFIYAKRWRRWKGRRYASIDAFARGDRPIQNLGGGRKYHFVDSAQTARGTALVRANGQVVPADQAHIYPLTKFHGWDLQAEPVPPGFLPAWAVDYDGTAVHAAPNHRSPVAKRLEYHSPILIEDEPVDRTGHWWMMPNALGPGVPGYVNDTTGIRHWSPAPPLDDPSPGEMWIDVDLAQQVLALRRGSEVEFVTLMSSGDVGTATPRGIFRIKDKAAYGDMASRPASDDPYYVENVPWVMHFKRRYAIHGTFWHWGFGHRASHGCINLSVRDARYVFDRISPYAYGGWHRTMSTPQDPGTMIRIRRGTSPVPNRIKG